MNNVYIFSKKNFIANNNNNNYEVNKNQVLKLSNIKENDTIKIFGNNTYKEINISKTEYSNYYRHWHFNDNVYLEIISNSFDCLIQKVTTKNFEAFIYNNCVRVFYKELCYAYYYLQNNQTVSTTFEKDNILYICNSINSLIFNGDNLSFSLFKTEKIIKNEKNIEILCKFPKNISYLLYFSFNFKTQTLSVKKLKKENTNQNLPIECLFFYLCKNKISDAKDFLLDKTLFENLVKYFNCFDDIVEIENHYYLYNSNQFIPLNLKFKDGIIEEVD